MAFYSDEDENSQNSQGMNAQKPEDASTQPQQLSSGVVSTAPVATGSQAPASAGASPKATSSGMTGFQNYQKANTGAATNKLAGAANTNVSNQAQSAKTGINQATTAFGQKVDTGSLSNRGNALQDVKDVVSAARNVSAPAPVTPAAPAVQTAQAGLATPVTETPETAPTAPQAPAVDPTAGLNTSRFQDVINAKYQGPESLRQSGEYAKASSKVQNAQTALDQSKTAQGREELLRNIYSQGGNYGQGLNKLDAGILNSSKAGVSQLQDTAKAAGNIQGQLDQAQIASANLAQNRTNEINDIRNQSRTAFTEGKAAEEAATEERLSKVIQDWDKLPQYFKDLVKNSGINDINSLESSILGVGSGEGLYNLGENAIATGVADKERLISRNEQARQAALAALGGLDQQKLLNTNLAYGNADLAGTQSALDALDLAGTRARLNEAEQGFQDFAEGTTLTGTGSKKNKSSGKRYYASESANIGDLLKNAGYSFGETAASNNIGNAELLSRLANISNRDDLSPNPNGLEGAMAGYTDPLVNMGDGQGLGNIAADGFGTVTGLNYLTGALGLGSLSQAIPTITNNDAVQAAVDYNPALAPANLVTNALGLGNLSSSIGSIFGGGSSSKESKSIAAQGARDDLQNQVQSALNNQGYGNRINVTDNANTAARVSALQQLLANLDKTNS